MKHFENILSKEDFSGVVLLTKNGETSYSRAFGFSDMANRIPNKLNTKFQIASGSKIFTAVSILRLVEDNKISLKTEIGDVLNFDLHSIDKKITVAQLLSHTSGIPDYFDEDLFDDYGELWKDFPNYKVRSASSLLPLFIDRPMMYKSGSKFKYNNSGFVVLGLIIEAISGIAFDEFVDKNIFKPAKMNNTGFFELDKLPANCANAYVFDEKSDSYYLNIYSVDVKGGPAGGGFTNANDMDLFWKKLLNNEFIDANLTTAMLSSQAHDDTNSYGYGVWIDDAQSCHIEGCDPGVCFYSSMDAKSGLGITILNNNYKDVWKYAKIIRDIHL